MSRASGRSRHLGVRPALGVDGDGRVDGKRDRQAERVLRRRRGDKENRREREREDRHQAVSVARIIGVQLDMGDTVDQDEVGRREPVAGAREQRICQSLAATKSAAAP